MKLAPPPKMQINGYTEEEILDELDKCAESYIYWLTYYCKTWNEETKQIEPFASFKYLPYRTYIFDMINTIHNKRIALRPTALPHPDLLILKSRQTYFTWSITAYITWCMLFEDNFTALISSDKQTKIDCEPRNSPNTNLGKITFIVEQLPDWMQPTDFINTSLKRGVASNNSLVTGDSGIQLGRGQAYSIHLGDEWAAQEFSVTKYASVAPSVKGCNVILSTPNGKNNSFYDLYIQAVTNPQESSFDVITPSWKNRIAPEDQDAYYEAAVRRYQGNQAMLAQDLQLRVELLICSIPQYMPKGYLPRWTISRYQWYSV